MIGFLKGTLAGKQPPRLTLEVGGVGYELEAPMSTFYELPDVGKPLKLVTHLVVREDAHILYGFSTEAERALFRELLKVSGIGARIALAILSAMSVPGFHRCVLEKDLASLVRVPGIGKKTAERLLVEMPDRLPEGIDESVPRAAGKGDAASEAHSALLALGYRPAEATRLLADIDKADLAAEELIREALRRAHAGVR